MEIWRTGLPLRMLKGLEVTVPGIRTFACVSVNGNYSFPYLDIQLLWNNAGKIKFNIYKKPGELIKYLNTNSHHHKNCKTAVLQGMELCLAPLTTVLVDNKNLSLLNIHPDKHEALCTAGQIKAGQKMRTLSKVLNDEIWSGPARTEKRLRAINKRDLFFIVEYAKLGHNNRPLKQVIHQTRNEFQLKQLHPHVVYSQDSNPKKKLLGNLKRKLLCGITEANLGCQACNCPNKHKVTGVWAYGGETSSCQTASTVYKISGKAKDCNCFYIGKSQRYIKKCIHEKIRPWARGLRVMRLKTIGCGRGGHPWWAHPYSS